MGILESLGFGIPLIGPKETEIPEIFRVPMKMNDFVNIEIEFIYAKILTDALERTSGIADKTQKHLWDSCLQSEAAKGLVTLLSEAMAKKSDLYLVLASDVLRKATSQEEAQIKADYAKSTASKVGVAISFKNLRQVDMIHFYSELEYLAIASLYKSSNASNALQLKFANLRSTTSVSDSTNAVLQAKAIATSLKNGNDVMMDSNDSIESLAPDIAATKASMEFLDGKRAFYLGMPMSYINGILTGGLGDAGAADARAVERGLKWYYFSILKPALEGVFEDKTSFKSEEFGHVETAMEVLKTFELVGDKYISEENKLMVVNRMLDLQSKLGTDQPAAPAEVVPPAQGV